jgi:hypothetical protein
MHPATSCNLTLLDDCAIIKKLRRIPTGCGVFLCLAWRRRATRPLSYSLQALQPEWEEEGMADAMNAVTWLRDKLKEPQLISTIITQWVGPLDKSTGHTLDELLAARRTLGVKASIGAGGYFLWTLPGA